MPNDAAIPDPDAPACARSAALAQSISTFGRPGDVLLFFKRFRYVKGGKASVSALWLLNGTAGTPGDEKYYMPILIYCNAFLH